MNNVAIFVIGPAGVGKSTFCSSLANHGETVGRTMHIFNMDPAADDFLTALSKDIRELITVEETMEELDLGPNGALLYCMDHLIENIDWLEDELDLYQDEYILIDCPGQIELYTHFDHIKQLGSVFERHGYRVCCVYLLESVFMQDISKYFAGVLNAMSAMIRLEFPHLNIVSKMDLAPPNPQILEQFENVDPLLLEEYAQKNTKPQFHRLNRAIVQLIEEYNLVQFIPCNIKDQDSMETVLMHIDHSVQYGEFREPKDPEPRTD